MVTLKRSGLLSTAITDFKFSPVTLAQAHGFKESSLIAMNKTVHLSKNY